MAIRVVQGLIDLGRSSATAQGSKAEAGVSPNQTPVTSRPNISQQQTASQQQQVSTSANAVVLRAQSAPSSEAALTTIRATRASLESAEKLRNSDEAQGLADSVADRIEEREDEALEVHDGLKPQQARQHFYN